MNQPWVSIIVPCFNHEQYVRQCIESVLRQPYENIELIVIDDASTDASPQIIRELGEKHGFLFEMNEKNQGLTSSLNEGIKRSCGKYLKFLASDDMLHPESIIPFVDCMEKNADVDACFGDLITIDKAGHVLGMLRSGIQDVPFYQHIKTVTEISAEMAMEASPIIGPSYLIRKNVFDDFGSFDESQIVEDWDLFLFLSCNRKKISAIPFVAGFYRVFRFEERPIKRSCKKQFLSDLMILSKYKNCVAVKSYQKGIVNLIKVYAGFSVNRCGESPFYFFGYMVRFPFAMVLIFDRSSYKSLSKAFIPFCRKKFKTGSVFFLSARYVYRKLRSFRT